MFNPQRKMKFADIYMQERAFQIHLDKMRRIQRTNSPLSVSGQEENRQKRYLEQISARRDLEKERRLNHVDRQNHRLFVKLVEADGKSEEKLQPKLSLQKLEKKHSSNFYNQKIETDRIRNDNSAIINRILNKTSLVPSYSEMQRDFKQNKRYGKMVRKLPAIIKYEDKIRQDFSMSRLHESRGSVTQSRKKLTTGRKSKQMTHQIENIEQTLIQKQ